MAMEWIVAAVFVVVGLIAVAGIGLGLLDPQTKHYKPRLDAFARFGRTAFRSEFDRARDGKTNNEPGARHP